MAAKKQQEGGAALLPEATAPSTGRERSPWEEIRAAVFTAQRTRLQGKDLTDEQKTARAQSYAYQAIGDVWLAISAAGYRVFPNVPVCHECRGAIHAAAELRAPEIQARVERLAGEVAATGERYRAEMAARS